MTPTRKRRLIAVALIILGVGSAAAVAFTALQDNMLYFYSPSDVLEQNIQAGKAIRLGGLVTPGSVERDSDSLRVQFTVGDGNNSTNVVYTGILPDLFREGQGVIAHGALDAGGVFHATSVLAKHDENYMPPEVAEALEKAGHPVNRD